MSSSSLRLLWDFAPRDDLGISYSQDREAGLWGKACSAQHKFEVSLSPEFNACAALALAINLPHQFSFLSIIGIGLMSIEKDVVSRAVKGDGQAFAQLYEENFDKIYRYVYLRLGNQAEAEDLSQEVFVKALEAIGSYKWRNLPFASWLFRIAHNQIVDYLRKHTKVREAPFDDNNMISIGEASPASVAEQGLEIEELIDAVKKLSPAQREVISLRFGAELSIAEVAEALGKSPGTVKALQYNGIVALRKMLLANR